MKALATATVAALLAAGATLATASTPPQTPSTAFAATAAQSGMIEVALGGLALQKSSNSQVRQLAQKTIQERAQANRELAAIVKQEGLILPTQMEAKYNAIVARFYAKSAVAFDTAYIEHMAKNSTDELTAFESAAKLSDPALAAFAQKTLSMLQEHRQLAANLHVNDTRTASAR